MACSPKRRERERALRALATSSITTIHQYLSFSRVRLAGLKNLKYTGSSFRPQKLSAQRAVAAIEQGACTCGKGYLQLITRISADTCLLRQFPGSQLRRLSVEAS